MERNKIKKIIALIVISALFMYFIICISVGAHGQTYHIYQGTNTNYTNTIYTITSDHLYSGTTTNYEDILYTFSGNKVYKGNNTNYTNLRYLIEEPYVMDRVGNIYYYNVSGIRIYTDRYPNYVDCILTYSNNHVYSGYSTNYSDILYTVDGPVSIYTIAWLFGGNYPVGINEIKSDTTAVYQYYDLNGKQISDPRGLCIEKSKSSRGKLIFIK